jgi:hypothetical protein
MILSIANSGLKGLKIVKCISHRQKIWTFAKSTKKLKVGCVNLIGVRQ